MMPRNIANFDAYKPIKVSVIMTTHSTAVVMGASSGLGAAVARLLAARGWRVGIAARRAEALERIRAEFATGQIEAEVIDVNSTDAPLRLNELIDRLGGIDLYFHSSGVGRHNQQLDAAVELATVETNVTGFTRMVTAAFNRMASGGRPGHIAVISSVAGTKGLGVAPSYSASKAFDSCYIQALEQLARMRRLPISFTDVRPGFVATPLLNGAPYPMLMDCGHAARCIVRAVLARRHVAVVDWRWRVLVAVWRRVPRWLWRRIRFGVA